MRIVEVAFQFLLSTDDANERAKWKNITFQYFMENVGCLSDHAMMGTLDQILFIFWFGFEY